MFKKINIKSIIVGIVIGIVLCSSVFADISSIQVLFNDIKVSLDGVVLDMKDAKGNTVQPLVYNGTTYLPARALCETLNKDIKMNEITNVLEITTRKEEVALMSENVGTVTSTTNKVTYRKDTDGLLIVTQSNIDYVDIAEIEMNILTKHNNMFNTYLFEQNIDINTVSLKYNQINNKATAEEIEKDIVLSENKTTTSIILKDIPTYKIKNNMIKIKYEYYLNNIKPLFNQESGN